MIKLMSTLYNVNPKSCGKDEKYCKLIARSIKGAADSLYGHGPSLLKQIKIVNGKFYCYCMECNSICILSGVKLMSSSTKQVYNPPLPLSELKEIIQRYIEFVLPSSTTKFTPKSHFYASECIYLSCPNGCEECSPYGRQLALDFGDIYETDSCFLNRNKNTWNGFFRQRKWRKNKNDFEIVYITLDYFNKQSGFTLVRCEPYETRLR